MMMKKTRPKSESFEEREKRQFALAVLDNPEQLMMYAQSTNDVSFFFFLFCRLFPAKSVLLWKEKDGKITETANKLIRRNRASRDRDIAS